MYTEHICLPKLVILDTLDGAIEDKYISVSYGLKDKHILELALLDMKNLLHLSS